MLGSVWSFFLCKFASGAFIPAIVATTASASVLALDYGRPLVLPGAGVSVGGNKSEAGMDPGAGWRGQEAVGGVGLYMPSLVLHKHYTLTLCPTNVLFLHVMHQLNLPPCCFPVFSGFPYHFVTSYDNTTNEATTNPNQISHSMLAPRLMLMGTQWGLLLLPRWPSVPWRSCFPPLIHCGIDMQ